MLHSSNTVLRLTIGEASYDLPETLLYFEKNSKGTNGIFELAKGDGWDIGLIPGKIIKIGLLTRVGSVETLDVVFITRKEFIVPNYGNVMYRFTFSNDPNSAWQIDPAKLDMIHYKSDRIYDYAVADAVKALNNTFVAKLNYWTRNSTHGDEKI